MVDTAIIYCTDGVLIYTPHNEQKYQEIHDRTVMSMNWADLTMAQAKENIGRLKD